MERITTTERAHEKVNDVLVAVDNGQLKRLSRRGWSVAGSAAGLCRWLVGGLGMGEQGLAPLRGSRTTTAGVCATCRFWEREMRNLETAADPPKPAATGECALPYENDAPVQPFPWAGANGANLYTHESFGCNRWEQAERQSSVDAPFPKRLRGSDA